MKHCNGLHCRCMDKNCSNIHYADCAVHNPDLQSAQIFSPTEYLFKKFQRMYSEKYGRIPLMTDKYDKAHFELFLMGYEACKKSIIVAHDTETKI